ncbi:hypothetical protein EES42_14400 [Streptomyces sp. ADI95-17]|nr:hypothetical protein EES42_14400 [Streptomyces sp. ADI95-17]
MLAYVPVAVAQQPVHPGAGARPGGPEQQFEQDRLLTVQESGPVQQIQCHGREERVPGVPRVLGAEQADRPDRAPLVQPAAQGAHRVQDLLRHHRLPGRLPVLPRTAGCARLPRRGLLGHDAQQQVGDDREGARGAVGRQPAQRRHRLVRVQVGAEQGQFPLVRAAEAGGDARGQVDGVEPYEELVAERRIAVQQPQQFEGAVPYGAQMGRRLVRGEAQPLAQGQYRPVPADRLQRVQGRGRGGGQQGDHGLFGVLVTQFADRVEERSGCRCGGKQVCDRVPDRELAGPLPGQGDQQG